MDFKAERESRGWKLWQVAEKLDKRYSPSTINGMELEGKGSDRLRNDLEELYGKRNPPQMLRDQPFENSATMYKDFSTETLKKMLAEVAAKIPAASPNDYKYKLGQAQTIIDELQLRELTEVAAEEPPKTVTAITKHGIVREEHANLRGVSSKVAERAKGAGASAAEAAGRHGAAKSPPSSKPASPTDKTDDQSDPAHQRSSSQSSPAKQAPK